MADRALQQGKKGTPGRWGGGRMLAVGVLTLIVLLTAAWAVLALWYAPPVPAWLRAGLALAWAAATCVALAWALRNGSAAPLAVYGCAFALLLLGWLSLPPSNHRDWAPDVARVLEVQVDGSRATLHNVRNFQWRSTTDFTERWETREYDLDTLVSADLVLAYWMGPAIAHTLVSFGFQDGGYLTFSAEIRRERDESFSAIAGFFRKFELSLVAADERDIVLTRSNARLHDVYLYRLALTPELVRELFLEYVEEAQALAAEPRWYNTLVSNCTTLVFDMVARLVPGLPMDYRLLLSGYLPEYVYERGGVDTRVPLEELRARGFINPRAHEAGDVPGFSEAIRRGVPVPPGGDARGGVPGP